MQAISSDRAARGGAAGAARGWTSGLATGRTRRLVRSLLIGIVSGLFGALFVYSPLGIEFEKSLGLRWLFTIRGPVAPPAEAVVVAINSSTGTALGLSKLPQDWPRTVHARLLDRLGEYDPALVVFDMDFSRVKEGEEDRVFADAIAAGGHVVLFERLIARRLPLERPDGTVAAWSWIEERQPPSPVLAVAARALAPFPLPKLGQAASTFWSFKESTGDAPTVAATALQLYALPLYEEWLALLRRAGAPGLGALPQRAEAIAGPAAFGELMGSLRAAFGNDPALGERVRAALDELPEGALAPQKRRLFEALTAVYEGSSYRFLNFYGPPGTIRTIPYEALLGADQPPPELRTALADRVVFVGYSDLYNPDQPDRFYTVFTGRDGIDLSGVEIMATAFGNLLTDAALRPFDPLDAALMVAAFGLIVGVSAYMLPALLAVPLLVGLAAAYAVGVQTAFNGSHLWLPLATPILIQLPLALFLGIMGQYLLERRKEREMSRAISHYLPENVLRDLAAGNLDPGSVNKIIHGTCLASDMSGFSSHAETMSPGDLAVFMNAYFDSLAQALKRHAVDVTEFHADTIMCAWTGPASDQAPRRRAVRAAVAAVQAIEAFAEGYPNLRLKPRIGLQDGDFYLGHTGGGGRLSYSILGDPANTAARLESLNKQIGTRILAAQTVVEGLHDELLVRPLGRFRLVGKTEATAVAEVIGVKADLPEDAAQLCAQFASALDAFGRHDWLEASSRFAAVLRQFPADRPAAFYLAAAQTRLGGPETAGDDPAVIALESK
ncbi:MAG TPA: adenylate/guanylate cyclase domain-containing protein [Geminicoccaceae bacterium]|nr:adenylate/guanylate cyclase domain-containing protein [Geminicoccaceae bacterium]